MGERLPVTTKYVDSGLRALFRETLDQLIVDLGRPVRLYFEPVASGCSNCGVGPDGNSNGIYNALNPYPIGQYHRPFPNGTICPICRSSHKILTATYTIYTALISRNPKDIDYDALGANPTNVYATKTVVEAFEDIKRCQYIIVDGEVCVRLRDPIKTGLRDLRYCKCWWKKQD